MTFAFRVSIALKSMAAGGNTANGTGKLDPGRASAGQLQS